MTEPRPYFDLVGLLCSRPMLLLLAAAGIVTGYTILGNHIWSENQGVAAGSLIGGAILIHAAAGRR